MTSGGEGRDLQTLEERARRQENESVATRNLFGVEDETVRRGAFDCCEAFVGIGEDVVGAR